MRTLNWIRITPVLAGWLALMWSQAATAQNPAPAGGIFVTVNNPISEAQIAQLKGQVDGARNDTKRNIRKVVFDFNPDGKDAATESFGPSYELADYIRKLAANGIETIAFVHGKVIRHSVLPAIACDQLVMSSSALIGEIWSKDRPVNKQEQDFYLQYAGLIRSGPVSRMVDKDVKLVLAKYKDSNIYVDPRKVEAKDPAYADVHVIDPTPVALPPGVGLYDVGMARKFYLCIYQAENRAEVKERYQLPDDSETADPLRGKAIKPVRIVVTGPIDDGLREKVRRQIESARSRKENTFFFVLETSSGGDPQAARNLADDLIALGKNKDEPARTIAFVPGNAPDLAIFLAFACQDIVMYKGPDPTGEAVLGDFEALIGGPPNQPKRGNPDFIRQNLADVAERTGHSKLLVEGMFDKNLEIYQAKNDKAGERKLMSEAQLKAQPNRDWVIEPGGVVKPKGTYLKLTATKAKNLRIARTVDSKDIAEVYGLFGVDAKSVRAAEPSWMDDLATFLRRPGVSILLVIVGIAGLILELKAPGLVVPGVVAAICFILFFWAQTQLGGHLIYLAIMLFLLGLALLGIEIFLIPGFGITGVCGILLVLAGLVLAGVDKAPESTGDWVDLVNKMLRYGLTMAGAGVLAFILSRYLPKIPYANRLMLVPPEDKAEMDESSPLPGVDAAIAMLGQVGTATSMLRPAGTAKFGDRYVDVVTEGDFIQVGTPVQVVEVEGTRVVVKRV